MAKDKLIKCLEDISTLSPTGNEIRKAQDLLKKAKARRASVCCTSDDLFVRCGLPTLLVDKNVRREVPSIKYGNPPKLRFKSSVETTSLQGRRVLKDSARVNIIDDNNVSIEEVNGARDQVEEIIQNHNWENIEDIDKIENTIMNAMTKSKDETLPHRVIALNRVMILKGNVSINEEIVGKVRKMIGKYNKYSKKEEMRIKEVENINMENLKQIKEIKRRWKKREKKDDKKDRNGQNKFSDKKKKRMNKI
ncbi:hypothetical protein C1645_822984 [Glomus cerebriforme]|uniref:Uncharacterized protein n=1 Tax=Glomus cerebriforme TaxID=658196 RepID=A0A397T6L8_9GLOM|nr:hypothetical protein C1645_822984 [Glomus cerebriforme]